MGFGIFWIEEGGEAYVGLGFRNVIQGDAGQSATKEEAGIAGMFFDDLGDGFLRLGKVLVENGLLGGGDGRVEKGIFVGPLGELTNIEKAAFLTGGIPQVVRAELATASERAGAERVRRGRDPREAKPTIWF